MHPTLAFAQHPESDPPIGNLKAGSAPVVLTQVDGQQAGRCRAGGVREPNGRLKRLLADAELKKAALR